MKIAVNAQHLLANRLEGIGWFAHETLSRIAVNHPEHQFYFIFDRPWDKKFVYADNVLPISTTIPSRHPFLWFWHYEVDIPRILQKIKPDVFFSPDGWMPLNLDFPVVNVIHDINFVHRPGDLPFLVQKYYNYFFPKFASKATRLITVSEYSKNDISETFNVDKEKIDVAHNGCNQLFRSTSAEMKERIRDKFSGGNPFFIHIGSQNPRKNINGLLEAYELFRSKELKPYKLLFAGEPMWGNSTVGKKLGQMVYKNDILFTGRISTEVLQLLLSSAEALVMPSFFEGFGIPVVEALYCEVPVICSNVTSLPEVAGDAALYIDPNYPHTISDAMERIIYDAQLRSDLVEKGKIQRQKFSWDKTAQIVWESIEKAINNQ
jgi:glycosyltransferase involved in cell wall biosynthesis